MSLNKGKAKAKPAKKAGGKPAVMNRRKYNEAISGDTMSNYAMYRAGGKVLPKAQIGKAVKAAVDVGEMLAKKVARRKIFGDASDDMIKEIIKDGKRWEFDPPQKIDKAQAALNRRNRDYEKAVRDSYKKKGGAARKYKSGGSTFPDLTGDGKVTRADILKGRGVIKKGGMIKKKK